MLPDRVSNPGPLTYVSGALPIALRGPAPFFVSLPYIGKALITTAANDILKYFFNVSQRK